ncbi:uncharacterized protein OCT59_000434 [Rhizophagus irregularis]|uniref:F-box domain-containing protein n=1 Tax=Rhizophagus irregularis (strain DAOM 181602 / DAOM 197198 / MUCL 43194) TaxID=747089 RepID=A0A2H5TZE1_RHIID|nr:hypothetical protein GLOIN_2v1867510 [Rhizophagus irregularis DAOM 181602=DAOM 197198]POG82431.1 hypothetical protein GLOIN_2v1867510 [Rhizophagus irregularis DAOM 181602=DAOM 197198]UZN99154.1 hypothetical protein OCT59_000434 [Rhizophagus irregularis]GBC47931.1 hypothetical protein GLOIN_2v1867510 [Rhizophagus irregularis DAOM 181602=DAOM 197198]|eukprot:XP_025189297.1 hypothetical protein GLOIN_2v1867510 [Rhizophagus irregularis DAOM 181602=DAOM 197198]
MTCSKIFSGDLPELINEVIKYFRHDYKTLHSCILVNRLWCRLAIPLLWEDPFSIKLPKNYRFIEIYLNNNLNEEDKTKLNEYGINYNKLLLPSNTSNNSLFNYPNFIKCLNTWKIIFSIEQWILTIINVKAGLQSTNYFLKNMYPNNFDQKLNSSRLIYKLLFKIFIENEVKLHTFEVIVVRDIDHDCFNDAFNLILQNQDFIFNIKNLKLQRIANGSKIFPFLKFLYSNCNSINSLYFQFPRFNNNNLLTEDYLLKIINSQKNLKKISFERNYLFKGKFFLSLKNSNCSNTLNTIIFYRIDFKKIIISNEEFENLNVLESIHILYCYSLNSDFIQQIINLKKPFKLKSLFMDIMLQIDSLNLLLQKSGSYLENIGFGSSISNELRKQFDLFMKYCKNIKFFELPGFDNLNIYLSFDLIKILDQNLNYLSIDFHYYLDYYYHHNFSNDGDMEPSSIVLLNLGQILPHKLEYLNLSLKFDLNNLEIFLQNSQNTFIKKLLIRNKMQEGSLNILPYIKKYIMKKERVKYLAIMEVYFEKREDLSFMKDEVKEFESYNIKVQNYDDLYIQVYDLIKEMD